MSQPALHDDEDRLRLHAAAAGDRQALAALYRRHHARLWRFLSRMTSRRDLVDEVINDTMWVVWCKAGSFRGDSKASTWITGIAYRCMLKALRDRVEPGFVEAWVTAGDELEDALSAVQQAADAQSTEAAVELRNWLAEGLRRLSEDQRITVQLVYGLGESCDEVAAIMGCAVGTVKARLFHARMRMRNLLPELGEPRRTRPAGEGSAT